MYTHRFGAAILGTGLLLSLGLPASGAVPLPEDVRVIKATSDSPPALTKSELQDLTYIAGQKRQSVDSLGQSVDSLVGQQKVASEFATNVQKVQMAFPDSFAGSSLPTDTQSKALIGFSGGIPKNVESKIPSSSMDIELRGDFPVAALAGQDISGDVVSFLGEATGATVMGGTSFKDGHVEITTSKLIDDAILTKAASLVQKSSGSKTPITITQKVEKGFSVDFQVLSGGAALAKGYAPSYPPTGGQRCTASFGVFNVQGGSGIMTADHCDDDLNYENRLNMNFRGGAYGVGTDAQWHSSTQEGPWNQFIWRKVNGRLDTRAVTSIGNPGGANATVCKYGEITNYDCAGIYSMDQAIRNPKNGVTYRGLTILTKGFTQGGDSGGPVFYGDKALGLISGQLTYSNGAKATFVTQMVRIYQTTSLQVLTS